MAIIPRVLLLRTNESDSPVVRERIAATSRGPEESVSRRSSC